MRRWRGEGGWPPKATRQQVTISPNNRNAETSGPERLPLTVKQRAITVPGRSGKSQVGVVGWSKPLKRNILSIRHGVHIQGEQPMLCEVLPLSFLT